MAGSGRFNFDDGGSFCGGWYAGMAEGYAVCSGPDGQGVFAGSWSRGFEVSGVYKWPNGDIYEGQWKNGKREGAGVQRCGEWVYRGEWARGCKNGYGLRQRRGSLSYYRGAWYDGLYHGYGMETYGDGGTYEGQWQQGRRQGFGVRTSAPYANAVEYRKRSRAKSSTLGYDSARNSILNTNETVNSGSSKRGGFTLNDRKCTAAKALQRSLPDLSTAGSKEMIVPIRRSRSELRLKPQHRSYEVQQMMTSMIGSTYSSGSSISSSQNELNDRPIESSPPQLSEQADGDDDDDDNDDPTLMADLQLNADTIECYMGQWRNDKRSGFGLCERSDGLKYEGHWLRNKKHGYGVTTYKDGTVEKGKYKENVFVTIERRGLFFSRRKMLKHEQKADAAVSIARRAARIALQKCEFVAARVDTANERAEIADAVAELAIYDSTIARNTASEIDAELLASIDSSNVKKKQYRYYPEDSKQVKTAKTQPAMEIDSDSRTSSRNKWRRPGRTCCCPDFGCNCLHFSSRIIKAARPHDLDALLLEIVAGGLGSLNDSDITS